jgi:GNAT superfamily N-acetyltransferase
MLTIEPIDLSSKSAVQRFIRLPFRIYGRLPQWVPPILMDMEMALNPQKHPFYEHSEGAFFLAEQDGEAVGRIAVFENRPFNRYHGTQKAQFYYFEAVDDVAVATGLFERAEAWARQRGLTEMVGPKGLGPLDGYGMLVEGFDQRATMTMMNYNLPYYPQLVETLGYTKEIDFVSCYLSAAEFHLPERVHRIATRVLARGDLGVQRFKSKRELLGWAKRIGQAYNQAFVNNWEYYPLSEREIDFVVQNIISVADPRLIKLITHQEQVVGFLFAFPDLSAAIQRQQGKVFPFGILDLLLEMRRTKWVAINGAGVLPEYHGRGGNALLYTEMEQTIQNYHYQHADLTQVAETAVQMRADLTNLGGQAYKNHRVFHKAL